MIIVEYFSRFSGVAQEWGGQHGGRGEVIGIIQQISLIRAKQCTMKPQASLSTLFGGKKLPSSHLHSSQPKHLPPWKSHQLAKHHSFTNETPGKEDPDSSSSSELDEHPPLTHTWSQQQDLQLAILFRNFGADWAAISQNFENKSNGETRRHFEKLIKRIVQGVNRESGSQSKHINFQKLKTAIKATSQPKSSQGKCLREGPDLKEEVSKLILRALEHPLARDSSPAEEILKVLELARKSKKRRSCSKASTQITQKEDNKSVKLQRGYQSDSSSIFESVELPPEQTPTIRNLRQEFAEEQALLNPCESLQSLGVVVEQSEEGIKGLLRQSGVLEVHEGICPHSPGQQIQGQHFMSSSQNMNNQSYQHFYEDSELERDCYWKKSCSEVKNLSD